VNEVTSTAVDYLALIFEALLKAGTSGHEKMADIGLATFFILLLVSFFASLYISRLYVRFYRPRGTGSLAYRSFPLLGVSVTAIFICVQFSLPLSLGLLGALSIVRFRTPIKEPEEIGFIMLCIATAISCATFNLLFLLILLTVSTLGLYLINWRGLPLANSEQGTLLVNLPGANAESSAKTFLPSATSIPGVRIISVVETPEGAAVTLRFAKGSPDLLTRVRGYALNCAEGATISMFNDQVSI
jgi:hypothetical protein